MNTLTQYVNDMNQWNSIFGMRALDLNDDMDRVQIAQKIDSELSPENLHCDGEISATQAQNKYNYYGRVIKELDRYCAGQGLKMPVVEEYY